MPDNIHNLSCELIKVDDPNIYESQWRVLEEKCNPSYFLTWDWIGLWANMIHGNVDLYLLSITRNNMTIALCFLTIFEIRRLGGLITSKQVMLNGYPSKDFKMVSNYNGLLVEDNDLEHSWSCLSDFLLKWDKEWDEIALNAVPMQNIEVILKVCPSLIFYIDKIESIWIKPIDSKCSDINHLLKTFNQNNQKRLQKAINTIENNHGDITLTSAGSTEEALKYFHNMEVLHTNRWQRKGIGGSFANKSWVNFHSNLIRSSFSKGSILIVCINAGTLNIGYIYAHIFNDTAMIQQNGFLGTNDRSFMSGYVSHCYTMAHCASLGIHYYDFLPDNMNSYKNFFTERGNPIYYARFQKNKMKFILENIIRYFQPAKKTK